MLKADLANNAIPRKTTSSNKLPTISSAPPKRQLADGPLLMHDVKCTTEAREVEMVTVLYNSFES